MTDYEKLLSNANDNNVTVYDDYNLKGTRIKGLYCDGSVAISNSLRTQKEKTCVLAEELGHFYTSTGNILDMSDTGNRKQEARARLWAYNRQVGLQGIINCYKANRRTLHDMADYLNVTEEFLSDAIECYRSKYGISVQVDNYVVGFQPSLYIMELFE